ncbi:uncharacterized protein [Penaeus vannamei]|uniref:uncharacterized protein n=1 Tax=Penaeus vannamei TaxID=6689 RepID=UPI00387F9539
MVKLMNTETKKETGQKGLATKTRDKELEATQNNLLKGAGQGRSRKRVHVVVERMKNFLRHLLGRFVSRGIPLLVRHRGGSNNGGGQGLAAARGRRGSTVGGPRRQLSRRVSRRDSRRGSKGRRRSSVHPPVHMPIKDATESEEEKEEKGKNPIRRFSKMISNVGPALVRRVSKLRRKSMARKYPLHHDVFPFSC